MLRKDLFFLGWLFLSICQVYAYRIARTIFYLLTDENAYDPFTWMFAISKTLLILGVFSALTIRMSISPNNRAGSIDMEEGTLSKQSPLSERRLIIMLNEDTISE